MKKIYLLLLYCVVFLCGCDSDNENIVLKEEKTISLKQEIMDISKNILFNDDCALTTNIPCTVYDNISDAKGRFINYEYVFFEQNKQLCLMIKFKVDIVYNSYASFSYKLYNNGSVVKSGNIHAYEDNEQEYTYPLLCIRDLKSGDYYLEICDYSLKNKEESENKELFNDFKFIKPNFPITVKYYFMGELKSKVEFKDCTYEFLTLYDKPALKITLTGEMTYGNNECTMFNYKIKDGDGYIVKTDHWTLNTMSKGDKFKDCVIYITDLEPGTYTIEFFDET